MVFDYSLAPTPTPPSTPHLRPAPTPPAGSVPGLRLDIPEIFCNHSCLDYIEYAFIQLREDAEKRIGRLERHMQNQEVFIRALQAEIHSLRCGMCGHIH